MYDKFSFYYPENDKTIQYDETDSPTYNRAATFQVYVHNDQLKTFGFREKENYIGQHTDTGAVSTLFTYKSQISLSYDYGKFAIIDGKQVVFYYYQYTGAVATKTIEPKNRPNYRYIKA